MDINKFFNSDTLREFKDAIDFQNIYSKEQLGYSFRIQDYLPLSLCTTKEKPITIEELKDKVEFTRDNIRVVVKNIYLGKEIFNKGIIVGYNKRKSNFSVKYLNPELLNHTKVSELDRYTYGPYQVNFEDIHYDTDYLRDYLIRTLTYTDLIIDFIIITDNANNTCGILAVEKGECDDYPDSWTIRIICNLNKAECKGYVLKLMGAYMYILKRTNIQEYGILELAGGFDNLNGYCTYTKFGFIQNPTFGCSPPFVEGRYRDGIYISGNLKMLSNVSRITLEQIISVSNSGVKFPIPRPLICDRTKFINEEEQKRYSQILQEDYDRLERTHSTRFLDNTLMYLKYNRYEINNAKNRLYPRKMESESGSEEDVVMTDPDEIFIDGINSKRSPRRKSVRRKSVRRSKKKSKQQIKRRSKRRSRKAVRK